VEDFLITGKIPALTRGQCSRTLFEIGYREW